MPGEPMELVNSVNNEIEGIVDRVRRGMVRVSNRGHGAGAGTVWHPDGLILTNAHVAGGVGIHVDDLQGNSYPAQVLAVDRKLDLAALSVPAEGLGTIVLGQSDQTRPGELVFSMGFPWGIDDGLTAGVLIGVDAWVPRRGMSGRKWVMASLHLRPGHSGGPMVNAGGELIGINTIMRGPDVGVAIPIETVKNFLKASLGSHQKAA